MYIQCTYNTDGCRSECILHTCMFVFLGKGMYVPPSSIVNCISRQSNPPPEKIIGTYYIWSFVSIKCQSVQNVIYMEIHVYSTLAYVWVGREERQPRQTIWAMNMHVHVHHFLPCSTTCCVHPVPQVKVIIVKLKLREAVLWVSHKSGFNVTLSLQYSHDVDGRKWWLLYTHCDLHVILVTIVPLFLGCA